VNVLLTAFEPFDGSGLNSSLEGCRRFLERWEGEYALRFLVLPVEYGPDVERVEAALAEWPAEVVLHTGQACGSPALRLERRGRNRRYRRGPTDPPDARIPILADGPEEVLSTLPVDRLVSRLVESGLPAVVTEDAGVYLCNHALYRSLLRERGAERPRSVGFLHVPSLPEQVGPGRPSLQAEETALAIRIILETLRGEHQ
jgi:pyroglutamyl-peptidase